MTKKIKEKNIFKKNGFSIITIPQYMLDQVDIARKKNSFIIDSISKKKIHMVYKHVVDGIFRDCKSDEYLLFVKTDDQDARVFIRTGYKAGGLSNAGIKIHKWIEKFYKVMDKDPNFSRID